MKKIVSLAVVLLAFGCATGYQSSDESVTGGYSETRLAPNEWRVLVEGNGFTERREVEQILMRRAAELTLEQGRRYFVLTDHRSWITTHRRHYEVITTPADRAIVTVLDDQTPRAFDALDIVRETNDIARGRLSPAARATIERLAS